jgi:hypothetical protein
MDGWMDVCMCVVCVRMCCVCMCIAVLSYVVRLELRLGL